METAFDAVIVANGQFPAHAVPLRILGEAKMVVACDGAVAHLSPLTSCCPLVIGDGDSVPAEYRDRLIKVSEQEDNDLTKATRYCIKHLSPQASHPSPQAANLSPLTSHSSPLKIAYLGATGLREDHTLGNIALMVRYLRDFGVEPTMLTDYGWFTPAYGDRTFAARAGQQVSILNFGCTHLASEGLRWDAYAYRELWQGTLNEAVGDSFVISADGYYMVYQTYDVKK